MSKVLLDFFGLSDKGSVREKNEDALHILADHLLFVVADGMGGHNAGEIAAQQASHYFCHLLVKILKKKGSPSKKKIDHLISDIMHQSNRFIHSLSCASIDFHGMGTTLTSLQIYKKHIFYAHIGDSRLYLFRNDTLIQLTKDHTLIPQLFSRSSHSTSSLKKFITQAIGVHTQIQPQVSHIPAKKGDLLILCSDGFSDYVSNEEIRLHLQEKKSIKETVMALIQAAKNNHSSDNITLLIAKIQQL